MTAVDELEFRLPDVGEGIATADVVAWKVAEGDRVSEHQEFVEVQTDKAIVALPSPTTGRVLRLCAAEGDTVNVGVVLAVFAPDEATPARRSNGDTAAGAGATAPVEALAEADGPPAPTRRPLAAPATRRLARELGVDLATVVPSGPQGRIRREDVEAAANAGPPASAPPTPEARSPATTPAAEARPGEVVPLRGVRRAIAHTLTRAWQEVPRVIDYREVHAGPLLAARARLKEAMLARGDDALAAAMTPTPLIVRAAVRALAEHPWANSSIDLARDEITLHRHVHLGLATASPDGLTVPVLKDADRMGLGQTARETAELIRVARAGRLSPDQLAGATFTVNNYGGLGIWLGTPIVVPPQVVNLGVGAIRDQVVAVDGEPVVRPTLALAVAADHRVLDADTLAAFVARVVELLEEPLLLLDDGA